MSLPSFPRALADLTAADPTAVAIVCGTETLTRDGLDRRSNQLARVFARHGVGLGDLVTVGLPNGCAWFVACLAAWKVGATPSPVPPGLPDHERTAILARADPKVVVGVGSDTGAPAITAATVAAPGGDDDPLPDVTSPSERALVSGGSTGTPKVIMSQAAAVVDPASPLRFFAANRCMLVPGPLYHGIPFASSWRSLLAGSTVVVMERFDASEALRLIEEHRVDRVAFVPTMLHRIARLPDDERLARDVSSLQYVFSSGAPCPNWLMHFWIDWLGPDVMNEGFGSTERVGGAMINGRDWLAHEGSVGKPYGGSQVRVIDPETGKEQPVGEMGELYWLAPDGPGTAFRYIGAERSATDDGWESIGDMGYIDEDGYLYLGDRRADMILSGGRNIYPAEIEAVLDAHPKVRSSVVIGLPDDDVGQALHALVEADNVTADELAAHVRQHLVRYKTPRTWEFVSNPLRDDAGKVRRTALRAARLS